MRKKLSDEDSVGVAESGILLDAHRREMAQTVYRKGDSLPSAASVHSRMVAAGTRARRFRAAKGRPGTVVSGVHFPARNPHRGAVGRGTADSGMFHHPAQPGPVHPARRAVLADCTPARCNAPNTHSAGKGHERDFAHRPHVPPRDRHCRPAVRNGRRAGLSVRKRRRPGPAGLSEPSQNGHSRR